MSKTCLILDHDLSFVFRTVTDDGYPAIAYRCRRGCGLVTIEDRPARSVWGGMVAGVEWLMRRLS